MDSETSLQTVDTTDLMSSLNDMLAPFIWLSVALTVVFVVFYVSAHLRRRKLENALFDIQGTLKEMNERDKARTAPTPPPLPQSNQHDTIIARTDERP